MIFDPAMSVSTSTSVLLFPTVTSAVTMCLTCSFVTQLVLEF